tara:strand:- start:95074 stop:97440 length:2367 start_codon:yes stop_codon:yes gene_type:complete
MSTTGKSLTPNEEINLKDQLNLYLRYWPWFLISVLLILSLAFLYLKYTSENYRTQATILIKDEQNSSLSELAAFEDLGLTGGGLSSSDLENEVEILKSKKLLTQVVEDLDLNVRYFFEGDIVSTEVYIDRPFTLKILQGEDNLRDVKELIVTPVSLTEFELQDGDDTPKKKYSFGEKVQLANATITLIPESSLASFIEKGKDFRVTLNYKERVVLDLQENIGVQTATKNSSVISLSLVSPIRNKSEAIINRLISAYNDDAIDDQNLVSKNTAEFIDKRLDIITQELDSVESNKVNFKQENRLTDIQTEGQLFLENASEYEKRSLDVSTKLELTNNMIDYLEDGSNKDLLPSNLGITEDDAMAQSIQNYNELIMERNRLLRSSTEKNPVVVSLTNQIAELRSNVLQSLNTARSTLRVTSQDLSSQSGRIGSRISQIPGVEKQFRGIERQQSIKEALYLYLLQKREETAISLAVTTPKAKIVDRAYSSLKPVSPKPKIVYLGSLVAGLLIPFLFVYTRNLLDTKIHNRSDIENALPGIPILGEIPQINSKESDLIETNDRSMLAESFRILRTNLSYFTKTKEGSKQVIYVTSTIKGEGKTFTSFNLGLTLTSTGKKVLLIGADLRNPQLHRYLGSKDAGIGLSEYLHDETIVPSAIINKLEIKGHKIDLMLSGRIPPNPAELLMSDRYEELLESQKSVYDIIIVDTAPTMLVTDTLLISQYADLTIYVSRAEYTEKKLLQYPKELRVDGKLKNIAFVVNDVNYANFGYGTKYGYSYGVDESWFERMKKRL